MTTWRPTKQWRTRWGCLALAMVMTIASTNQSSAGNDPPVPGVDGDAATTNVDHHWWTFERGDDTDFNGEPDGFERRDGVGFPKYVRAEIVAKDPDTKERWQTVDTALLRGYQTVTGWMNQWGLGQYRLPLPPSIMDFTVDHYYQVVLDGGQFQTRTRAMAADPMYQYRLRIDLRCKSLLHDRVTAEIIFVDDQGNKLASRGVGSISGTRRWTTLETRGIVVPLETVAMYVRLSVVGGKDGLEDIRGEIGFDNIRINRYPQLQVATDRWSGIYRPGEPVVATARAMGLSGGEGRILFALIDHHDEVIVEHDEKISPIIVLEEDDASVQRIDQRGRPSRWALPALPPGHYRVRTAAVSNRGGRSLDDMRRGLTSETSFVVLNDSLDGTPHGIFGWSLDRPIDDAIDARQWAASLVDSGLSTIKYPCWIASEPESQIERIASLLSRAQDAGVLPIGRLDGPPLVNGPARLRDDDPLDFESETDDDAFDINEGLVFAEEIGSTKGPASPTFDFVRSPWTSTSMAASTSSPWNVGGPSRPTSAGTPIGIADELRDIDQWQPKLEPVMSRLALKVRRWQLGRDDDFSFLTQGELKAPIAEISRALQGFGQPLQIAIAWPWMEPIPATSETSWQANVRGENYPLTASELDVALENQPPTNIADAATWLSLRTIDGDQYSRDDRIIDLVQRMMTVRRHRVAAAYVTSADHPRTGLLRDDGRPGELYLPWRTTARLIGNLRHVGDLNLASGTNNAVMIGSSRTVLVLWSATPRVEELYLGTDVTLMDVWGRTQPAETEIVDGRQVQRIGVGPIPIFVLGADPMLLAFRMGVRLSSERLDSLLGEQQRLDIEFVNPAGESLLGSASMQPPPGWQVDESNRQWDVAAGQERRVRQTVVLSNTAKIGQYSIPIDFRFDTTPPQRITVHRDVTVGPQGLMVTSNTRRLGSDGLTVRIEMTNTSAKTQSYDCLLFPPPGRRYQLRFMTIPPGQTVRRDFVWTGIDDLRGRTMLLRAVEQDGNRVLNYDVDLGL